MKSGYNLPKGIHKEKPRLVAASEAWPQRIMDAWQEYFTRSARFSQEVGRLYFITTKQFRRGSPKEKWYLRDDA